MGKISNYLSPKTFKKMISGKKKYLPKGTREKITSAKLGRFLYNDKITKQKAIEVVRRLQDEDILPKYKNPSEIYNHAAREQYKLDEEIRQEEIQKHVRTNIAMDISEEMAGRWQDDKRFNYRSNDILGKPAIDGTNEENRQPDDSQKNSGKKASTTKNKWLAESEKPSIKNLPDMPIDFND